MAAGTTYTPIATTTLGSATANITFSSISGSYTDLVLICTGLATNNNDSITINFNSDTGTNYSLTNVYGNGSSVGSSRTTNSGNMIFNWSTGWSNTDQNNAIVHLMNYSNTTTYKTIISRSNTPVASSFAGTEASVNLWRSTAAITSIKITDANGGVNLPSGFTATLYGITAA